MPCPKSLSVHFLTYDEGKRSKRNSICFQLKGVEGTKHIDGKSKWVMYPNPTSDILRVFVKGTYSITDLSGLVLQHIANTTTIDVSSFNAGVYFISNQQGETKSCIKN